MEHDPRPLPLWSMSPERIRVLRELAYRDSRLTNPRRTAGLAQLLSEGLHEALDAIERGRQLAALPDWKEYP